MINNKKIIKEKLKDLSFKSILSLHLYASFSKWGYQKQELILATLESLERGEFGKREINDDDISFLKGIDYFEDQCNFNKFYVFVNGEKFQHFASTNVSGWTTLSRHFSDFGFDWIYEIQDRILNKIDLESFEDIYSKIDILKHDGNIEISGVTFKFENDIYIPATPYSLISLFEDKNWEPKEFVSEFPLLKSINSTIRYISKFEYEIFMKRFDKDKFDMVINFLRENHNKIFASEFSLVGLLNFINGTGSANTVISKTIILSHPWEYDEIWSYIDKISILEPEVMSKVYSDFKFLSPNFDSIYTNDVVISLLKNDVIEIVNYNYEAQSENKDLEIAILQTFKHLIKYSGISNRKIEYSISKTKVFSKTLNFELNIEELRNISTQKKILRILNSDISNEEIKQYKPFNVTRKIDFAPFSGYDNNDMKRLLNFSNYIHNEMTRGYKKINSFISNLSEEERLKYVNDEVKLISRKILKYNNGFFLARIELLKKATVLGHYSAGENRRELDKSDMVSSEKVKGIEYFENQRKTFLGMMKGIKFAYIINNNKNGNMMTQTIDLDIINTSILLALKATLMLHLNSKRQKREISPINNDDDGIISFININSNGVVGSSTDYNLHIYEKERIKELDNLLIKYLEDNSSNNRYDSLPSESMGFDRLIQTAWEMSNNGNPVFIFNNEEFTDFLHYFTKIWTFQLENFMRLEIPSENKKIHDKLVEITSNGFEKYIYEKIGKQGTLNKKIKVDSGIQEMEFDIFIERNNKIIIIECLSFINARSTHEIINRYNRISKKRIQNIKQRSFLEKEFPDKEIIIYIVSNKKTYDEDIIHYKDMQEIIEEINK